MSAQGTQISPLSRKRAWFVPHERSEVSDRNDVIIRPEALD